MCNLTTISTRKSATGYKIVAERAGKKYSVAMGFRYNDNKPIPIIEKQKKIALTFSNSILTVWFSDQMVGRTAIFKKLKDAQRSFKQFGSHGLKKGFSLKLYKAKVSVDLIEGAYDSHYKVIAGRKIKFIEEVN